MYDSGRVAPKKVRVLSVRCALDGSFIRLDSSRLVFTLNDAGTKALAAATTTPSVTERSEGMFRLNGNDRASDDTRALVRAASDMRALPQFQKEVCDGRRNRPQWK